MPEISPDARLMLFIYRDIADKGFNLTFRPGLGEATKGCLDHEAKTAYVDPEADDWLYTLAHEHGHICQQYENTDVYRQGDDDPERFELDADLRAWRNLVSFGVFAVQSGASRLYVQFARLHALARRTALDEAFQDALAREVENPALASLMPVSWYAQISPARLRAIRTKVGLQSVAK